MASVLTTVGNPQESHDPLPAWAEAAREVTLNPLSAKVTFECLPSVEEDANSNENDGGDVYEAEAVEGVETGERLQTASQAENSEAGGKLQDARQTQEVKHGEQFMRVVVQVPQELSSHLTLNSEPDRSHIIIVADRSGSMAGNPWNQVKHALLHAVSTSLQSDSVMVDIIVYAHTADLIEFTPQDYESKIGSIVPGNLTNFVVAFKKVDDVLKQRAGEQFASTSILFMTDGADTASVAKTVRQELQSWGTRLRALNNPVTVHTVGFSKNHDFRFLQELSSVGSRAGLFRYCEPGDGPDKLKEKVEELFDYTVHSLAPAVDVVVEMDGENKIISPGKLLKMHSLQGDITHAEQDQSNSDGEAAVTVQAEMWVLVHDLSVLPAPVISLSKTATVSGTTHTFRLPCTCSSVERKVLEDAGSRAMWGLSILSRNTDALAAKIAAAIEANQDVSGLQNRATRLQNRLANTRLFGQGIEKDLRESMTATLKEIQAKMDMMHSMLARYSRGETASVSILARAHDLRYEARFKKSRRQRLMHKRVVQNVQRAKADQAKLEHLQADEDDIALLSDEAVDFFFCALSQDSVVDILRDVENKENAIGFGLAVTRPEFALDDPTSVRLCLISGTLVSRTSMLDALQFKINLAGHLQAHNGFSFFSRSIGYATVGAGREPINAWLPLYVTESHWERVKVILKPSLGYLVTLDPLGFDWRQLDVLFMVLGAMIGQLSDTTVGLHQLQLLFAFQRTCAACVRDFNLTDRLSATVRDFLREPKGRFKNVVPNLYTLIGYIAALPVDQSRRLLGYAEGGCDSAKLPVALWRAVLAETLRRAAGTCFKSYSDRELNTLVDLLLHGRNNSLLMPPVTAGKAQEAACLSTTTASSAPSAAGDSAQAASSCPDLLPTSTPVTNSTPAAAEQAAEAASLAEDASQTEQAGRSVMHVAAVSQTSTAAAHFTIMCTGMAQQQNADLYIHGVEPLGESGLSDGSEKKPEAKAAKPAMEFEHSVKMDRAMEVWSQAELGIIRNKNQAEKVSLARKHVKQWVNEGRELAGLPTTDAKETETSEIEEEQFDCDAVDSSILEITVKLLTRLSSSSYPPLSALPGAMAFLHAWLSDDKHCWTQMTSGLPPSHWIDSIKAAVAQIYSTMDNYVSQCGQQVSNSGLDVRKVLVIEGGADSGPGPGSGRRGHGKRVVTDTASDEDDDSDVEDYSHLEEDDPMKVLKRRQQEHRGLVTLPMILHVLDPCANKVKVTRAMLCQAVLYCTNSRAKEAASNGTLVDLKETDGVESTLRNLHKHLVQMCIISDSYQILWQRANAAMMQAQTIWAFLGYLMNTYKERDEGFGQLMADIAALGKGSAVPCLADKVRVLLTGQWEGHKVLARGNSCVPGKDLTKKLEKVLGEEVWAQIEVELHGNINIHVYRESDIPNRHGHCNSNPYIPPSLRLKLKMPLK